MPSNLSQELTALRAAAQRPRRWAVREASSVTTGHSSMQLFRILVGCGVWLLCSCSSATDRVPLPRDTPFDACSEERAAYLVSFREGYEAMLVGLQCSHCVRPVTALSLARSAGWSAGQGAAHQLWWAQLDAALELRDRSRLTTLLSGLDGDIASRVDEVLAASAPK